MVNVCRTQLLNKCQEEFVKGAAAMEAVDAREQVEQGKTTEQKQQEQAEGQVCLPAFTAPCTTIKRNKRLFAVLCFHHRPHLLTSVKYDMSSCDAAVQ